MFGLFDPYEIEINQKIIRYLNLSVDVFAFAVELSKNISVCVGVVYEGFKSNFVENNAHMKPHTVFRI